MGESPWTVSMTFQIGPQSCNRTKERIFVLTNSYLLVDALTQAFFFRYDHRKIDSVWECRALGLVQVDVFDVGRA